MSPLWTLTQPARNRRSFASRLCNSGFLLLVYALFAIGCDGVQEDRHIEFSPSGNQVAFQHGNDGIFVADPQTGKLQKVFDPDPSVVAVSTPIWADDESAAIFTTARVDQPADPAAKPANAKGGAARSPAQSPSISAPADWNDLPEGRFFFSQPVVYTCWLVERPANGPLKQPVSLFEARANHSGYVAANLAVRWNSRQKAILFVDRESPVSHAVWLFNLEKKSKTRIFPPAGQVAPAHVIAEFLADGGHIACLASDPYRSDVPPVRKGEKRADRLAGIWIGSSDGSSWWHVAESVSARQENSPQWLSHLIARRPAYSHDGRLFAFVREETVPKNAKPQRTLLRAQIGERKVEPIFKSSGEIANLRWSSDGSQLGFIEDERMPRLKMIDAQGHLRELLAERFLREFAGWNPAGDRWACVVAEKMPPKAPQSWALLLIPDPLARDAVLVVDRQGTSRTIASGLHFTFPQWSTKGDQLSMWGNFAPSHQSLAVGVGLRSGDPAAIVDVATGSLRWMAINGDEQAQVGHYFLQKGDAVQAREWYRKADQQLPELSPLRPEDFAQGLSGAGARRRTFELFYWYCLKTLGETTEASARLAQFDKGHRIEWPASPKRGSAKSGTQTKTLPPSAVDASPWSSPEPRRQAEALVAIAKSLSAAQVFLSLDNLVGAQAWFIDRMKSSDAAEKLGDLVALSQLHLLKNENQDYATLVTDRLAPLLFEMLTDPDTLAADATAAGPRTVRIELALLAAHALGPLFCDDFLRQLPTEFVAQLVPKWKTMQARSHSQVSRLYVDLFRRAAAVRLHQDKERDTATAEIRKNSMRSRIALPEDLPAYFATLRRSATLQPGGQL
jgi:hypothetical protein